MSEPTTIVAAYASIGSGHRIAAESIAEQLRELAPDSRVELLDVLEYGSVRLPDDVATSAFTGPTAPLYNAVWNSASVGRWSMAISRPAFGLVYRRFLARIAELHPDVVVATHALAASLAVRAARAAGDADSPRIVAAATDFGLHGFWPHRGLALFCVADNAERDELLRRGTEVAEIAVTGIPVRSQFEEPVDRAAARERFDLPDDRRVVLALSGATQPGPYARFKESLAVSLPAVAGLPRTTVAVVTGRDHAFAEELRQRVAGFGAINVRVLGYVEEMALVMAAADVAVCKPGGLVAAECIAVGLPMILIGPAAGQERANARALAGAGAAVYENDPRRLAEIVRKTLAHENRLGRMRTAIGGLQHPGAAHTIAQRVLELSAAS